MSSAGTTGTNKKKLLILLPLAVIIMSFCFSAQDAVRSTELSLPVDRTVARMIHKDFDEWPADRQYGYELSIDNKVRDAAHCLEYTLLGAAMMAAAAAFVASRKKAMVTAAALGAVCALADEIHQIFVPGRAFQLTDLMIDAAGICIGAAAAAMIIRLAGSRHH